MVFMAMTPMPSSFARVMISLRFGYWTEL